MPLSHTPTPRPAMTLWTLPALPRPAHLLALGQAALLAALPQGGQRIARRNAWAGQSADAVRGRARREADAAVALAGARSYNRAALSG